MPKTTNQVLCRDRHGGTCKQPVQAPEYTCRYPEHNLGRAHIYGKAGASVSGLAGQFGAEHAKAGTVGERAASRVLWQALGQDPAVHIFQDVKMPNDRYKANADFVVVRGNRLVVVDAKLWPSGFYWTMMGLPYKGPKFWKPYAPATSRSTDGKTYTNKTVKMGVDLFGQALKQRGKWSTSGVYLIVPPYRDPQSWRRYHTWALRLHGSQKIVAGSPSSLRRLRAAVGQGQPAPDDLSVLSWLRSLTPSAGAGNGAQR